MTLYEEFIQKSGLEEVQDMWENATCVKRFKDFSDKCEKLMDYRMEGIFKYSFAILTEKIIEELKEYSPFLEVGAGSGYWAYEFKKRNFDYIATDPNIAGENYGSTGFKKEKLWTDILPLKGTDAVKQFGSWRSLLICWPSLGDPWACKTVEAYPGNTVIYVGEGYEGCTADNSFHELLEKEWTTEKELGIPQWFGIHDIIQVYKRKT